MAAGSIIRGDVLLRVPSLLGSAVFRAYFATRLWRFPPVPMTASEVTRLSWLEKKLTPASLPSPLPQAKAFYSYWSEPAAIRNLKRGLASLLQVQLKSGKVVEVKKQHPKTETKVGGDVFSTRLQTA